MYLGSLDGGLPICLDKFTANEEKNHVQNKNDYYLPKYSRVHISSDEVFSKILKKLSILQK